jgi:hypothetical protein
MSTEHTQENILREETTNIFWKRNSFDSSTLEYIHGAAYYVSGVLNCVGAYNLYRSGIFMWEIGQTLQQTWQTQSISIFP